MEKQKEQSFNEWLVINSQHGDSRAFDQLLRSWQPRMQAYAMRRLRDREAARDVVQESLFGVTRGLWRLRDPAAFPAWCYRLLERRCVDYLRRAVRDRDNLQSVSGPELEQLAGDTDTSSQLDNQREVSQALDSLDGALVALLKLYYQDAFSVREIAGIMGIPEGTVKSRLFYARKVLAEILEESK